MRKQTKLVAALSATALLAIGASAVTFAAGWNNTTGNWQYLDNDGNPVADDWRKSGDYWFYLGSDGNMATNEVVQKNDDFYYVNQDGAMVTNQWVAFDTVSDDSNADHRWMYFGADGRAYRDHNEKLTISDIKTINGKKYLFDQEGYMLYGWLGDESALVTGDDAWENAKYYYGGYDDGSAQHGWVQLTVNDNGEDSTAWFYFDDNGKIQRDKKKVINGATYYFDGKGRMIEDWSSGTKVSPNGFIAANEFSRPATASVVYVNGDGAARKNQWVWAVASHDYIEKDYDNDTYRWWWSDGSGRIAKDTVKKIRGKVYAFDSYGRMLSGLQASANGRDGFSDASSKPDMSFQDLSGVDFMNENLSGNKLYFFSDDYAKDGSRKTGYQKVEFDDDTYQMYFGNNGVATSGYVNKIKKYTKNGVVLAADNDTSNYAYVSVNSSNVKELASGNDILSYWDGNITSLQDKVLVNTNGVVQRSKVNLKDSNDIYYTTDKDGRVEYASEKKLYTTKGSNDNPRTYVGHEIGGKKYYVGD